MDNQLAYIDQAAFLALRANGHESVQQFAWVYDHDVNLERLREVHENFGFTLLGRRIERSPLPFGRHRWIAAPDQSPLEEATARPRSELMSWIDEQGMTRVDPEHGPSWRMAVLPFIEGGGAVTLVVSHSVADVGGVLLSAFAALAGTKIDLGYPKPHSRVRRIALQEDFKAFRESLPDIKAAFTKAVATIRGGQSAESNAPRPAKRRPETAKAIRPTVFAVVDIEQWDARAKELGGNSGSLVAGVAIRLGYNMGQVQPDGLVTLNFPVNERKDGDNRANALTGMSMVGDPAQVVTDLGSMRRALVAGLRKLRQNPNQLVEVLPLSQVTPKAVARRLDRLVLGDGPVVGCSNMGDVPEVLTQIDGSPAQYVLARGVEWPIGPAELDRIGNWLFVGSGRVNGKVLLFVTYWKVGSSNTRDEVADLVKKGLADFGLNGTFV